MNAREEFERIKSNTKDLRKAMIELGRHPTMNESDLKDLETLIKIIDAMDKKIKHDLNSQYGQKVQLSSLYGVHKEIYKNVDVVLCVGDYEEEFVYSDIDLQIDENFIKIIAHKKDKDFITIYSVKYIHNLKIRPTGKIEELFESEVE